jgi:hypothetical protein
VVSRFVRKVRTASGAVAVQIVTRRGRQVERVEQVGSAHSDAELALLLSSARERLSPGQDGLDLGDLPAVAPRMDEVADWTSETSFICRAARSGRRARRVAGAVGAAARASVCSPCGKIRDVPAVGIGPAGLQAAQVGGSFGP